VKTCLSVSFLRFFVLQPCRGPVVDGSIVEFPRASDINTLMSVSD